MEQGKGETMSGPFDLVLGRKTYETFAAHWSHTDEPGTDLLNNATKHVASTTLTELEWENSMLIEGQEPEGIRALKAEEGPRAPSARQREPDSDAAQARASRRVPLADLPARAR
jgi:dihydrofolate reductase